jgi:hypothetical protein
MSHNGYEQPHAIISPTDEQINKDLHEQVMKKCWHEPFLDGGGKESCKKCQEYEYIPMIYNILKHPDYLNSWNDYGELLAAAKENIQWYTFVTTRKYSEYKFWSEIMLNPRKGSMAIWEFFCKSLAKDR